MRKFEGPNTWDAVDMQDLERVVASVTTAAMPSTDNKELASRLAMQAAAIEAENSDPLGRGQIDPRQIHLASLSTSQLTSHNSRACGPFTNSIKELDLPSGFLGNDVCKEQYRSCR